MRIFLTCAWLIGLHCGVVVGQEFEPIVTNHRDYKEAYRTGVAEADKRLKAGKATLYIYGLRTSLEFLDRETGIPLEPIAGCVVDNAILGRADGNNNRIKEFIAERGLPSNSFKRWEKDLFDLRGYYEKRTEKERPFHVSLDGPAAQSADGEYTLRLVKTQHKQRDGTLSDHLSMIVSVAGIDHKEFGFYRQEKEAIDGFWGPTGSGFAVIRCNAARTLSLIAFDLERGKLLRRQWIRAARP